MCRILSGGGGERSKQSKGTIREKIIKVRLEQHTEMRAVQSCIIAREELHTHLTISLLKIMIGYKTHFVLKK